MPPYTAADLIRTVVLYLHHESPQTEAELSVLRNAAPNQKNIRKNTSWTSLKRPPWEQKKSGRCRDVLNKSQSMDFFVRRDKKISDRRREVAISEGSNVPTTERLGNLTI